MTQGTQTRTLPPIVSLLRPIEVQVDIPQMQCVALSPESGPNNERDETYILFSGKTPATLEGGRLPRYVSNDSYYEYWAGKVNKDDNDWTNHDQAPVGRPVLWTGMLKAGESAEFVVTVMEQDNSSIGILKDLLETGLNAADALFGSNATAKTIITTARELAKYLPESKGHDFIGAFAIQVANVAGKLQTTFIPIHSEMMPSAPSGSGEQTALFDCLRENGAHYRVVPAVRIGPALPVRTYLGKETDRCGEALLAVEGGPGAYKGFYHVGKGKAAWVPVAAPRFAWYCQTSKEWTTAPNSTNLVNVYRSAGTDREITWYCYNEDEQGFRPDYRPTQTWVKLSTEIDQCSATLLSVEGVGGFYHLAPGQQKWVPLRNRAFHWYCDISPERAVAPEETNLVLAKRNAQTRQITWECCREIVSLQPYTTPDDTKVLIGRETDQCSADRLTVFGDGGFYFVGKGEEKWVPISNPRFIWLCGLSQEASTAPEDTNLLLVKRHPSTREITWMCYRSAAHTFPYRQPDSTEIYLGNETDQCSETTLQVGGANGKVTVVKGQVGVAVPLASPRFDWWCGGSDQHKGTLEHATARPLTNLLKVTRAALSREITWECYLQRAHHQTNKLAALLWPANDKAYFFKGESYARYERDPAQEGVEPGYPRSIGDSWPGLMAALPDGIDAAVVWPNGKAYFFSGNSYVAYGLDPEGVLDGYPQYTALHWPGWPDSWADGIDAGLVWDANIAYFFKGSEYIRYNIPEDRVEPGYPRPIAGSWPGLAEAFPTGVGSAIDWGNGYVYFFQGDSYVRYCKDPNQEGVEAGYPRAIAGSWPGLDQFI